MKAFCIKHADAKTKAEAWQSLIATLAISFLPLIIGFLAISANKGITDAFFDIFLTGNLYFYAMSICAGIYVLVQLDNKTGNVAMRLWSGVFVLFCGCFMAFYIGQSDNSSEQTLLHGVPSILFLAIAVWINFRVLVLANGPPPPPEVVTRDRAQEMVAEVEVDYDA